MAKQDRIDFRVDEQIKAEFTQAADVFGMNLSTFMIAAAKQLSARASRIAQLPSLSNRDRDLFLAALDRPARPIPESTRKAKMNYTRLIVSDE